MLPEKKLNTNLGIGLGFLVSLSQVFLVRAHLLQPFWGYVMAWVGLVLWICGCVNYAEGKGHSKWFGLLGLLSFIGLAILVFMPDRNKDSKAS